MKHEQYNAKRIQTTPKHLTLDLFNTGCWRASTICACCAIAFPSAIERHIFRHCFQVCFGIAVQNQVCISKRVIVDQIIQLSPLEAVIGNFVFNGGAVNGNLASIIKNQFHAGCVYVELTGYKFAHGHTSKMFFEVNQAVNFRVIIGGNHIEICRKSFKTSRCERLVRIK